MDAATEFLIHNYGMAGLIVVVATLIWWDIRASVKEMADSLTKLTTQMAIIVERVDSHEKRLDRIEER